MLKEKNRLDAEYKECYGEFTKLEARSNELNEFKTDTNSQINKQRNLLALREKDFNDLNKQLELEKEKEAVLLADK